MSSTVGGPPSFMKIRFGIELRADGRRRRKRDLGASSWRSLPSPSSWRSWLFSQNPLGKIDPLMELRHLLPKGIHLGQELRILHRLRMPRRRSASALPTGLMERRKRVPPPKISDDGEYSFHVHSVFVLRPRCRPMSSLDPERTGRAPHCFTTKRSSFRGYRKGVRPAPPSRWRPARQRSPCHHCPPASDRPRGR